MPRSKRILWLTAEETPLLLKKKKHLSKQHLECFWVNSLKQLADELSKQRVPIILVSEGKNRLQTEDFILGLSCLAEARGARWILALQQHSSHLIELAACTNFRDFIPMTIPDNQWLYRVLYSSASQALDFPIPSTHITLDHPAKISIPCRIIWLNSQEMRIECHISPPKETKLELTGQLFQRLDDKPSLFTVKKVEHIRLNYRFSTALEGTWETPDKKQEDAIQKLKDLGIFLAKPKHRIFLALKSPLIRKIILQHLSSELFDVNSALQLKSLLLEPLFYTPDIIFIEDVFCCGQHKKRFLKMLQSLEAKTPVVIIGSNPEINSIIDSTPQRVIKSIDSFSLETLREIMHELLPQNEALNELNKNSLYLETDEIFSCALIHMPGRLKSIHPMTIHISCLFELKNFSLCKVSSPFLTKWLGKNPWLKLTYSKQKKSKEGPVKGSQSGGYFADLSLADKKKLAKGLSIFISKVLGFSAKDSSFEQYKSERNINELEQNEINEELDSEKSLVEEENFPLTDDRMLTASKTFAHPHGDPNTKSSSTFQEFFIELFRILKSRNFKYLIILLIFTVSGILSLIYLAPMLSQYYNKSGAIYVDQLGKFKDGYIEDKEAYYKDKEK